MDYRARVDAFFRSDQSPLTADQREAFTGLAYFPADPGFRFVVRPDVRGAGEPVSLMDSMGNTRSYRVHSRLHLKREAEFSLVVYESLETPGHLFLAFQDATTGDETYGAGRYLELGRGPKGTLIVDFNFAKNPFCAYNADWACPLPPAENVIPLPVRAGEKAFPGGH